jgi:hypothetical protein
MLPVSKVQDAAMGKAVDMVAGEIEKGTRERDELLSVYNESVKGKISSIVNQHKIAGAIAGPLPTHGVLTTINMIVLYRRLGGVVDIKVMQELDAMLSKAISASRWSFVKLGTSLFAIKQVVSILDFSVFAAPLGVIMGAFCGYKFTHRAGLNFAKNISNMVDEVILQHEKK